MQVLVFKAFLKLLHFELLLGRRNFAALYEEVRHYPVGVKTPPNGVVRQICSAVDWACIWYWKEVLCLQRSAVTVCLLKEYGVPAQMVFGAQQLPFKAHAWVEVNDAVINDKPYIQRSYAILDRC